MKVFITIGAKPLNGYTTIDPLGCDGKISKDIRTLDTIAEQAQCTEILAPEILDYIHCSDLLPVMQNWVSKLRHGGSIIVGGTDASEIADGIVCGQLNTIEFNQIIYGSHGIYPFLKIGMYTRHDIESLLRSFGLKIIYKRINNRKFTVEAKRV